MIQLRGYTRFAGSLHRAITCLGVLAFFSLVAPEVGAQDFHHRVAAVPMKDGANLLADVYLPPGEGPFPVVLLRTPYGRGGYESTYAPQFTRAGYAIEYVQSVYCAASHAIVRYRTPLQARLANSRLSGAMACRLFGRGAAMPTNRLMKHTRTLRRPRLQERSTDQPVG